MALTRILLIPKACLYPEMLGKVPWDSLCPAKADGPSQSTEGSPAWGGVDSILPGLTLFESLTGCLRE